MAIKNVTDLQLQALMIAEKRDLPWDEFRGEYRKSIYGLVLKGGLVHVNDERVDRITDAGRHVLWLHRNRDISYLGGNDA